MKNIFLAFILLAVAGGAYVAGYTRGGHDFALMDHVTMGMLSDLEIARCQHSNEPERCYRWNQESTILHALVFYVQYRERLSPLAPLTFPENHRSYDNAVGYLLETTERSGPAARCAHLDKVLEDLDECVDEAGAFITLAKSNRKQ